MTVSNTWTNPSPAGTLDLASGATVQESHWDAVVGNFLYIGGATGLIHTRTTNPGLDIATTAPAVSNLAYSDGHIQLTQATSATAMPRIGFHEVGSSAVALYKAQGTETLRIRGATGVDALVVTDTQAATLTNKTLTSPTINTPTINTPTTSNPTFTGSATGTASINLSGGITSTNFFGAGSGTLSTVGVLRMANGGGLGWRNGANTADLTMAVDSSNRLALSNFASAGAISIPATSLNSITISLGGVQYRIPLI